ncbi:hypothetical protein UT300005_35590 [Clostridium sp. CTA-5]
MKILIWGVYIISIILFVLGSIYLSRKLINKFKMNRWVIAFAAPLILIIPRIFFENINPIIWAMLVFIFMVLCVLFFELNNGIYKEKQIKKALLIEKLDKTHSKK